jgi:hypothetical protein
MPEALPELVPLAVLLLCFAFVWVARKFIAAMFKPIIDAINAAHIPYVSAAISSALHTVEQSIDSALGSVEHGIDSLIGSSWHALAHLNSWLWREFTSHTLIGALTAEIVSDLTHAYRYLHGRVSDLTHTHGHDTARIKRLEREYRGIEAHVKTLENDYSKGIGHDVLPRIKTLEHEAAHIQNVEIPAIRAADSDAADAISNLYDWIKGKATILGVGTFSLAVATALGALGLGNLTCPSFLRNLNRRGCGMWNGVEDMLGLFVDLFVIADLCEVIPLLETAYEDVAAPAVGLLTSAIDAMPCVSGYQAPPLHLPQLYLPSNPSLALSLP